MIAHYEQKIESALQALQNHVENDIIKPLQESSHEFFDLVQDNFDQVKQILQNGLEDQQRDKAEVEQIQKDLEKLKNSMGNIKEDSKKLREIAEKMTADLNKKAA